MDTQSVCGSGSGAVQSVAYIKNTLAKSGTLDRTGQPFITVTYALLCVCKPHYSDGLNALRYTWRVRTTKAIPSGCLAKVWIG